MRKVYTSNNIVMLRDDISSIPSRLIEGLTLQISY